MGAKRVTTPRRTEIADAALRIIGERGITSLTTATLAAELGVSSGAPFRHFASLDELLEETAHRVVELVEASFPPPGLGPLLALGQIEADALVLIQGAEAAVLDGGVVDEEVGAAFVGGDEAETLLGVEPLNGTLSHCLVLKKEPG